MLRSLSTKVDELILGGGIANTVLAASGVEVGRSLLEREMTDIAGDLLNGKFGRAKMGCRRTWWSPQCRARCTGHREEGRQLTDDDMILDIGPETTARYAERLAAAGTIVWNGPLGVFEHAEFQPERGGWPKRRRERRVLHCGGR